MSQEVLGLEVSVCVRSRGGSQEVGAVLIAPRRPRNLSTSCRQSDGVTKPRLNSLAGLAQGCLENDPGMEGVSHGGGWEESTVNNTGTCISGHSEESASPRRSQNVNETAFFVFHFFSPFQFLLLDGRGGGRERLKLLQPPRPQALCSPVQGSQLHTLLCSSGLEPGPHTQKEVSVMLCGLEMVPYQPS